jgi:hypothetical protein
MEVVFNILEKNIKNTVMKKWKFECYIIYELA